MAWGMLFLHVVLLFPLCRGDCEDPDCTATLFLQIEQRHQLTAQAAAAQVRHSDSPVTFPAASCAVWPYMCEEPFDCLNATGTLESLEDLQHGIAKPSGTNLQSWCYSDPRYILTVVPQCFLKHDLLAYANVAFEKSVEAHPLDDIDASYCFLVGHCQNDQVNLNTTIPEAEAMCDARYPEPWFRVDVWGDEFEEPNGWRSVGFSAIPAAPKDHFTRVEDAEKYVLFACAMGNYHCDVIYCRESYCHKDHYKEKFQHLAPK